MDVRAGTSGTINWSNEEREMLRKLKDFHRKTMEEYRKGIEEEMEPWKKRVMMIHELVEFLFYPDEIDFIGQKGQCIIRGDLVRGQAQKGDILVLLDGQGNELARGRVLTDPQDKEVSGRGLFDKKLNEMGMDLFSICEKNIEDLEQSAYQFHLKRLIGTLSMVVNP